MEFVTTELVTTSEMNNEIGKVAIKLQTTSWQSVSTLENFIDAHINNDTRDRHNYCVFYMRISRAA